MAHGLRFNDKKQFAKTFTQIKKSFRLFPWSVLRDLQRGFSLTWSAAPPRRAMSGQSGQPM
jgi:hypothetical protein